MTRSRDGNSRLVKARPAFVVYHGTDLISGIAEAMEITPEIKQRPE